MKNLVLVLCSLLLGEIANAHHDEDHQVFIAGERGQAKTVMCDTKAQIQSLLVIHKHQGVQQAKALLQKYATMKNVIGEPVCAFNMFQFIAYEQVFADTLNGKTWYVVKVGVPQRNGKVFEYYILSTWNVEGDVFQKTNNKKVQCHGNCIPV